VVLTLADMEGNESFDASCLGEAEEVVEKRVADDAMVSVFHLRCTCITC
jgi:T-complex protein 1 subunit alpha